MDTSSPSAIARLLFPKVPFLLKTALWHSLWLSPTTYNWDLRTELTIKLIRSLLDSPTPTTITKQQRSSLKDPGIKGPMWISKVTFPKPGEDDVLRAVINSIDALKQGEGAYTVPEIVPVEAEWTGYRFGVHASRPRLDLSEEQHYQRLMDEVKCNVTILYFHGGAYYLLDPASHRPTTSKLAKLTGGRCLSVRYRLSPQNAFPAALLDALVAYLSLLAPPPGSSHAAVSASDIVFSGDSAGGNLSICLLQLILQLHRSSGSSPPMVRFNGRNVEVSVPAGVTAHSGWMDLTRCMPSITDNTEYDYLPPPPSNDFIAHFPKCDIWPTDPPRGDLYCETSMLCHPLVSPLAARDWRGTCPILLQYGSEMLEDEGKAIARRVVQQGGIVKWEEWKAMPHCFAMLLEGLAGSKKCFESWAQFIKDVVEGNTIETSGRIIQPKTLEEHSLETRDLMNDLSDDEIDDRMREAMRRRDRGEEGEAKILPRL